MNIFEGFKGKEKRSCRNTIKKTGVYNKGKLVKCSMRESQREVFNQHGEDRHVVVNQPPGAGKSTVVKFVFGFSLDQNTAQKAVIAVPQTLIAKTFRKIKLEFDDGSIINWDPKYDLCNKSSKDKINNLVDFLKKEKFATGSTRARVMICTHAALAKAYEKIDEEDSVNKQKYLDDLILCIDEAHHILNARVGSSEVCNKIGSLVSYLLTHHDKMNTKIWLTTATMFRGDGMEIIKSEHFDLFKTYYLPLDRHWKKNVRYIKSYSYDFVIYHGSPFPDIKKLLSKKKNQLPTIVFCPRQDGLLANGCKYTFVRKVMDVCQEAWPEARMLDLVTEDDRFDEGMRMARKEQILDEALAKGIDIVFAVNIFDEGADWEDACQIIDLAPTNSLRILYQRFGRLLRDKKGKKHIHYYTFLPFTMDQLNAPEYRKRITEHFAAFTASLLLEEYIKPVPVVPVSKKGKKGKKEKREKRTNPFREEITEPDDRAKILMEIEKQLMSISELHGSVSAKRAKKMILKVLRSKKVKNRLDAIAVQIIALFNRRIPSNFGLDVSEVVENGFDEMWDDRICKYLKGFGSGVCSKKTYKDFRKALGCRKPKYTFEEARKIAQEQGLSGGLEQWQAWKKRQKKKGKKQTTNA